jgi:hypothetical protein
MRDELYNGESVMDAIDCLTKQKPKPTYKWLDYTLTLIYLTIYLVLLVKIVIWLKNTLFG